jgi:hypothetical protein
MGADTVAAEEFPNLFGEIIDEGRYLPEHVCNVDKTCLFWKRITDCNYTAKKKSHCLVSRQPRII